MIKKTIKYTDFNGTENEEVFYFNLTKAELTTMEVVTAGGMSNYIKEAVESGDNAKILALFNDIILKSYGKKSDDGKRFIKSSVFREEFEQSAAYSELFMEMITNPDSAEAFMKAICNQA